MTRPEFKKETKSKKEEVKSPGSPRSQKWISNLLPVLESYNYNHADIIKLVKGCDYNADKIQVEVEKIVQMNLGHEQGEWELVKPNNKEKSAKTQTAVQGSYANNSKFKGKTFTKDERLKRNVKSSPKSKVEPKPEKVESEDEKKELFTSWASLLKRDMSSSNQNLSNLTGTSNVVNNMTPNQLEQSRSLMEGEKLEDQMAKMKPAVVMPKEYDYAETRLTFGCLEDEMWMKPWSDFRQYPKQRTNVPQSDVFSNYYENKQHFYEDFKKFERFQNNTTTNANNLTSNLVPMGANTNFQSTNVSNTNLPSNNLTGINLSQNNLSTSTMVPTGLSTSNNLSQSNLSANVSNNLMSGNVSRTNLSGKGVMYNYFNENMQNPPGLYYASQPFFFPNNSNNVTSMWQN